MLFSVAGILFRRCDLRRLSVTVSPPVATVSQISMLTNNALSKTSDSLTCSQIVCHHVSSDEIENSIEVVEELEMCDEYHEIFDSNIEINNTSIGNEVKV